MKRKTKDVYRSAVTGKFVKKEFAKKWPQTTIKQRIKLCK